MTCPHEENCPLFKVFQAKALLKIWTMRYCESDQYAKCERYKLSASGLPVPRNLLPNGHTLQGIGRSEDIRKTDQLHSPRKKG